MEKSTEGSEKKVGRGVSLQRGIQKDNPIVDDSDVGLSLAKDLNRGVKCSGCRSSPEDLRTDLAGMPFPARRSAAMSMQKSLGNRFVQGMAVQAKREPNRTGMPDSLKSWIESISGIDMSDVRVHHSSSKPAQLNALAYTQGQEIHVAPGQEKYLSHEAWHAVQQAQGSVKPTMQLKDGVSVNDDEGLEHEADVMGAKATQFVSAPDMKMLQGKFGDGLAEKALNNKWLPVISKAGFENLSGKSMDGVKVHFNSGMPEHLNALAYAQGTNIHVGSRQEHHLSHEAWHVVQQKKKMSQSKAEARNTVAQRKWVPEGTTIDNAKGSQAWREALRTVEDRKKPQLISAMTKKFYDMSRSENSYTWDTSWNEKIHAWTAIPRILKLRESTDEEQWHDQRREDATIKAIGGRLNTAGQERVPERDIPGTQEYFSEEHRRLDMEAVRIRDLLLSRRQSPKAKGKLTPHISIMQVGNTIYVSSNTGAEAILQPDEQNVIKDELKRIYPGTEVKVRAGARGPSATHEPTEACQHAEMHNIERIIRAHDKNIPTPRPLKNRVPLANQTTIYVAGNKLDCMDCHAAIITFNEMIGPFYGIRLISLGHSGVSYAGWATPRWLSEDNPTLTNTGAVMKERLNVVRTAIKNSQP